MWAQIKKFAQPWASVAIAVLAYGWFAPVSAFASCGDHVNVRRGGSRAPSSVFRGNQDLPTALPCPCRTDSDRDSCPGCCAPSSAPADTVPVTPRIIDDWAAPHAVLEVRPAPSSRAFRGIKDGCVARRLCAVFRPPRA
jgi:hypothetical protein